MTNDEIFSSELTEHLIENAHAKLVEIIGTREKDSRLADAIQSTKSFKNMRQMVGRMIKSGAISSANDITEDTFLKKRLMQELESDDDEARKHIISGLMDEELARLTKRKATAPPVTIAGGEIF